MSPTEPDFSDPIIGHCLFTDGARRPVFQDQAGRQYVVEEGERIDGTWLDQDFGNDTLVTETDL